MPKRFLGLVNICKNHLKNERLYTLTEADGCRGAGLVLGCGVVGCHKGSGGVGAVATLGLSV